MIHYHILRRRTKKVIFWIYLTLFLLYGDYVILVAEVASKKMII